MVVHEMPERDETIVFHKSLDQSLKRARDGALLDDEDTVIFIDGQEGSGKSQTARQIGYMLARWSNTSFGLENVHNDLQSYIDFVLNHDGEPGTVCILDEGKKILNKFRQMAEDNVKFTDFLSENRDYNMHHIICAPSYHQIGEYVAKWRMRFLLHHYKTYEDTDDERYMSGRKLVRGNYYLYDSDENLWYHYDQPGYSYPKAKKSVCHHTIKDVDPLTDEEQQEYKRRKHDKIEEKYGGRSQLDKTTKVVGACIKYVRDKNLMTKARDHAQDWFDIPKTTFRYHVKKWQKEVLSEE